MAIAGGIALLAMIAIVVVSVIGRTLIWAGLKPILGDYELISTAMGFAIFAFSPAFIILSGSINNDGLCVTLSLAALLYFLATRKTFAAAERHKG